MGQNRLVTEKDALAKLAHELGVVLDATQLHIGGERAIMSPYKYVLTGSLENTQQRVVMKCAKHPQGVAEIEEEHTIHAALTGFSFAEQELMMPEEIMFKNFAGYTVLVTRFIEQEKVFTDHSLMEQFFMALQALEAQESFHATTREHHAAIIKKFRRHSPQYYLETMVDMQQATVSAFPAAEVALDSANSFMREHATLLETYDGYLMHSDFVPHNFRIKNRGLFLLDFVSFTLGNKYESWARLINFMEVHSPELAPLLSQHVRSDRGEEEYLALRLMRIYKIIFLLNYYAQSLAKTTGNLRILTSVRLDFWAQVLKHVLTDKPTPAAIVADYHTKRSQLRTPEEKERQRQFTWA